jgi:hypothetical protein
VSHETLNKLLSLQGITYEWNDNKTSLSRPEGMQYGFTAQNIREVFPELVSEDADGFLQTAYGTYDAMYVEAFRALTEQNKAQSALILTLESRIATLEKRISDFTDQSNSQ